MPRKNDEQKHEIKDDIEQSDEATEAALLELIIHIAYMCARHDYLDFYQKWLDSLQTTIERE